MCKWLNDETKENDNIFRMYTRRKHVQYKY